MSIDSVPAIHNLSICSQTAQSGGRDRILYDSDSAITEVKVLKGYIS